MPNTPNAIQPATGWAIATPEGAIYADSVSERRATAIEWAETFAGGRWAVFRRREGVRCVRVTITAAETAP